jgi:hypothetical protein
MRKHTIVAMVQIETDDPRLVPSSDMVATAAAAALVRQVIVDNLPRLTRVIGIFGVDHARMLMMLHESVGDRIAAELGKAPTFKRPPADYKPPSPSGEPSDG